MDNELKKLKKMSFRVLLKIIYGGDYSPPTSAGSTQGITDYTRTLARTILYERENCRTFWILIFTVGIFILTIGILTLTMILVFRSTG
jgi:hypothetical protein